MDTLIHVGQPAPDFSLPDLQGQPHSLSAWRGRIVALNFWSAECTWSERVDGLLLAALPGWGQRVQMVWLAANASEPAALLAQVAGQRGLPLLLHDAGQQAANLYGAQNTPHLFVVDEQGTLRYQGAFDDVTFRQRSPTRGYLFQAVEALLSGQSPDPAETPPYGCTIVRHSA
jgi:peroxiredoxin